MNIYEVPKVDETWFTSRETHKAVATAIHAIAGSERTPEEIWDNPTPAEWDQVTLAVESYVANGVFPAEDDGRYAWGVATIKVSDNRP